jgi:hypothetical protein
VDVKTDCFIVFATITLSKNQVSLKKIKNLDTLIDSYQLKYLYIYIYIY